MTCGTSYNINKYGLFVRRFTGPVTDGFGFGPAPRGQAKPPIRGEWAMRDWCSIEWRPALTRRALLRVVFVSTAGTLLAACSSSQPAQPAPASTSAGQAPAAAGQPVDVTFITTQTNDADVKIYQ